MKDRAFGDLLREFRCAAGLSEELLAERARLSPGAISTLERSARRGPQQQTLSLLAEALHSAPEQRAQLEEAAALGRRRRAGRSVADGVPSGASSAPNNLPHFLTSFHGREADLADMDTLIASRRLITLLGYAGVGKTRLSLEAARYQVESARFPDGIWFVELAVLGTPELVTTTIARLLGVRERPGEPLMDTLVATIASKKLFLILDNCEHVVAECARVVETLLRHCPGIVTLTTTREALRIDGECVVRVRPLPVVEDLTSGPALDLLLDRLIDADFARFSNVSGEDRAHATTICKRLDGVPLALELAAGRAGDLSLSQIVAGLDERFMLLADGRRTALPRQHTLGGMIDWSFALLAEREREVFSRLGLFAEPLRRRPRQRSAQGSPGSLGTRSPHSSPSRSWPWSKIGTAAYGTVCSRPCARTRSIVFANPARTIATRVVSQLTTARARRTLTFVTAGCPIVLFSLWSNPISIIFASRSSGRSESATTRS